MVFPNRTYWVTREIGFLSIKKNALEMKCMMREVSLPQKRSVEAEACFIGIA